MNTYYEIVKEYKKEFSTRKFARKYLSSMWIFRMGVQGLLAIAIAIWGVTNDYDFYIVPYLLIIGLIMWQFLRRLKKIDNEVIREMNRKRLYKLLIKYKLLVEDQPELSRSRILHLITIMNRELRRSKVSTRISRSIIFITPIAIKFLLVKVKWEHSFNSTEWLIMITFCIMLLGFFMMIIPLLQILLDRGYQKEVEFRNRLDELMLTSDFTYEN